MGGVKKVVSKITDDVLGFNRSSATTTSTDKGRYQAATEAGFQESEGRKNKKATRRGKKKLQIPSNTTAATTTGGTGLGTGA
jgi:hypothetical protein